MKTYKTLITELRVKTVAQRRKIGRQLSRRMKSSTFRKKIERSKLRVASPEKQNAKAHKLAKKAVIKKYYPTYDDMSITQRMQVDQRIAKQHGALIEKLAKRLLRVVKRNELEKVKSARKRLQDKNK